MIKISKLIKESEEFKINESDKRAIMDSIRKYNQYGTHIYSNTSFHKAISELKNICELGSNLILQETEEWFDSITVKRDTKSITDSYKLFEKTSNEITALQRRLESLYEDIGHKLNKYYEIDDIDKDSDRDELTEGFTSDESKRIMGMVLKCFNEKGNDGVRNYRILNSYLGKLHFEVDAADIKIGGWVAKHSDRSVKKADILLKGKIIGNLTN